MIENWRQCGARQRFVEPRGSIWDVKVGFEIPGYGELAHGGFSVAHLLRRMMRGGSMRTLFRPEHTRQR